MDDWSYAFSLPTPAEGAPVTAQEAERILLARVEAGEEVEAALWELARFYSLVGRQDLALTNVERLASLSCDAEDQAACFLAMGQLMEQQSKYEAALGFYRGAFQIEPADTGTWYLINNNLGYCLNHFGRHQEAEVHCLAATRIDGSRPNAYKNLGISLEGQSRYADAARCFVQATRADASDARALSHLEELLRTRREEVAIDVPEIDDLLDRCREAVVSARDAYQKLVGPNTQR